MNRRNLIKNGLMALAVSLLPKVLRPIDGEVTRDNYVSIEWEDGSHEKAFNKIMELVERHKPSDNYNFFWYEKTASTHSDTLYLK